MPRIIRVNESPGFQQSTHLMLPTLHPKLESVILETTQATSLNVEEAIQELWSGYGNILRIKLTGAANSSVIAKYVTPPNAQSHPRGWNTSRSHERKLFSYQVESSFYEQWSSKCGADCRVATFLAHQQLDGTTLLVMEDLDAAGYADRLTSVDWEQIDSCLRWLANFHATFMGCSPDALWKTGTYWHLDTRPDEWSTMDQGDLKDAASTIDSKLNQARFQTFVHGDAKLANFCFSSQSDQVAAVDFQYVGGGCGMKDVAYFIGSCLNEDECEKHETALLDCYFNHLEKALMIKKPDINPSDLIDEWQSLYHLAWTDFHRFLKGWCPDHWKINSYSERIAIKVIQDLCD